MHVFLDDFTMYDACDEHLHQLHFFLERCHSARLSLNPAKCAFGVTSGTLLGHIVNPVGIVVDPDKVKAVIEAPPPTNAKALRRFLGKIRWHSHMIRYLVDVATPLHATVHKIPF